MCVCVHFLSVYLNVSDSRRVRERTLFFVFRVHVNVRSSWLLGNKPVHGERKIWPSLLAAYSSYSRACAVNWPLADRAGFV